METAPGRFLLDTGTQWHVYTEGMSNPVQKQTTIVSCHKPLTGWSGFYMHIIYMLSDFGYHCAPRCPHKWQCKAICRHTTHYIIRYKSYKFSWVIIDSIMVSWFKRMRRYHEILQNSACDLIGAEWRINASWTQATIGSDNGLSPVRRQTIIWTSDGLLIIDNNFNDI